MEGVQIIEVKKCSAEVTESLQKLLPQLTKNYKSFNINNLDEITCSDSTRLFLALDSTSETEIIGSYTMVIFRIPTGKMLRIEDVIVDENRRGEGIGKKMMQHAIDVAKSAHVDKIELTSHPFRIEANKLYQSLGFRKIDTNVYRYII